MPDPVQQGEERPRAVPDRVEPDVYGHIDYFDGATTHHLSIGIEDPEADIVLSRSGWMSKHPFDHPRFSTEDERAAAGWTW